MKTYWDFQGIFNITENRCQHFQPVLESDSIARNGVNWLDIKAQPYPEFLKIINLP